MTAKQTDRQGQAIATDTVTDSDTMNKNCI